jgi:serine/threonine protein kinase
LFCAREPGGSTVVKIVDFGVSKQLTSRMRTMTNPTESVGSPQYMSPEQISTPAQVDPRTDIWSLGVVMFELLTGALPFNGPGPAQICAAVLSQPVPPLSDYRKDVPPALEFILLRCLEKDRTRRFASVTDLAEALSGFAAIGELPAAFYEVTEDDQLSRPRRRGLGALFGLVVLAACGAVLAMGVRDGRIQVPGREAILQQVPSELRALRSTFDRALRRAPALPVHRDE